MISKKKANMGNLIRIVGVAVLVGGIAAKIAKLDWLFWGLFAVGLAVIAYAQFVMQRDLKCPHCKFYDAVYAKQIAQTKEDYFICPNCGNEIKLG